MHPVFLQIVEPLAAALAADGGLAHPLGKLAVGRPLLLRQVALHGTGDIGCHFRSLGRGRGDAWREDRGQALAERGAARQVVMHLATVRAGFVLPLGELQ